MRSEAKKLPVTLACIFSRMLILTVMRFNDTVEDLKGSKGSRV